MGHKTTTLPLRVSCFLWHVLLHACFSSLFWRSGNHYAGGVHRKAIVKMRAWSKLIRPPDIRFVTATPYTSLVYLITDHTLELSKIEKKVKLRVVLQLLIASGFGGKMSAWTARLFTVCIWLAEIGHGLLWLVECNERFTLTFPCLEEASVWTL